MAIALRARKHKIKLVAT